ncbi:asparaginase [Pseudosulfitobacter pseudonitzschiae]|uniref:asparaginase n=1 Tax=Pseudosulfitobacter pseudonitzschiae TaxID=1402135 RepID=UPI001AF1ECA1|nr:asparaginase [Pseudosulfitobacter pseudonitzschiae]MBM1815683.1 asparaginase [Pseudosulfitobacter pseudonitzschiae]MBM1832674.1 asparaginase [Pseudosulfitobacter pseudonitzschiae]MBM1837542.1 asparaginase [Pseudosulfitobacter pseudonitzschiae]MBM1842388.1 asparaginase [Pseudosulfitobacter pseudonitzschiae]MBM1847256.1 asparaginase [Pseudosulfitobacter pseudonitzschiae]
MSNSVALAEVWRGPFMESVHRGHAVVCDDSGQIVHAWGDPQTVILPRSSAKMIQALPLIESGAADAHGLGTEHLALACASHNGAAIHTDRVTKWLDHLGLDDDDFRCGLQEPDDREARNALIRADARPCQMHNNCSGKHSGFLTLNKHLGSGPDYVDPDHAVQRACLEAFERVTGESSPGFGIDGCSAPNFATSLHGMARAMSHFAAAPTGSAEERLRTAMTLHPDLVAGEGRACTNLMRAMGGKVAIKTGAEAFFIAIIPELKMGVALKIEDGGTRAAECAIAAILVKLGVLAADHPETLKYLNAPIRNRRDLVTGAVRAAPALI